LLEPHIERRIDSAQALLVDRVIEFVDENVLGLVAVAFETQEVLFAAGRQLAAQAAGAFVPVGLRVVLHVALFRNVRGHLGGHRCAASMLAGAKWSPRQCRRNANWQAWYFPFDAVPRLAAAPRCRASLARRANVTRYRGPRFFKSRTPPLRARFFMGTKSPM